VSSKGRDLKRKQWKGYSRTSLAKCEEKAETAGVSYFAWTDEVYGGYCKVLKSSVRSPDLSTYQGYGYQLYEKQCPENICEDRNEDLAAIMMVEGYTCAMALDDYPSNMCANELFLPYCCQTCSMKKALIEAQVGQACTWPVSSKGRDLKRKQWKGYSRTSLAKCEEKAETAGVSYFAWTDEVYGGYCKVLKSSVRSPDLSTYQGYGYKLYEKQCPETVSECTPREMGGNTGRPAYKVQPVGTTTCPDNHFQVTSHIACDDFIEALCLKKGSAWEPDLRNAVCLLNGDRVEFYYLADLEQPQIVCVESSVSITLPPLGSESSRTSMSNEVLESTGAKWFVLMFALVGAFAMMFAGAKVIYKRACASSEFRKILDAPEC